MEPTKQKRHLSNYLLEPGLQVWFGVYSFILALIFFVSTVLIFSTVMKNFFSLILELTGVEDELLTVLTSQIFQTSLYFAALVLVYAATNVIFAILYTHKLVGPTVAFKRHIRALIDGRYDSRVSLRKGDGFEDLADELNALAHTLEEKEEAQAS